MTVASNTNRVDYTGDGVTVAFPIPFKFILDSHIQVYKRTAAGIETQLALSTDFTLTGAGVPTGGTATLMAPPAGPASADEIVILRVVPFTQESDYIANDSLPAETVEQDYDLAAMRDQQLDERLGRTVSLAVTSTGGVELPGAEPDKFLGWDSLGGLVNKDVPPGTVIYASAANTRSGSATAEAVTPAGLNSLVRKGANVTAAASLVKPATVDLGRTYELIGDTTVAAIWDGDYIGETARFRANGSPVLTHSTTLINVEGGDIPARPGDQFEYTYEGASIWRMTDYFPAFGGPSYRRNLLVNGSFQVDQIGHSATSVADDVYCLDQWYVLTQTAAIQVTQQALQKDGAPYNIRLTQNQVAAQRMGLAQIIEARDSQMWRARNVVLSALARLSAAGNLRYAVLGWTGTADTVTSDIVNDWTSGAYSAGNFFLAANLSVIAVGQVPAGAAAWVDLPSLGGAVPAAVNNLIVFVWTEAAAAQNVTLDLALAQCEPGMFASRFEYLAAGDDLIKARRFFRRIRGGAAWPNGHYFAPGFADTSGTTLRALAFLSTPMRANPTVTLGGGSIYVNAVGTDPSFNTGITFDSATPDTFRVTIAGTSLTAGDANQLYLNGVNDWIDIRAQL